MACTCVVRGAGFWLDSAVHGTVEGALSPPRRRQGFSQHRTSINVQQHRVTKARPRSSTDTELMDTHKIWTGRRRSCIQPMNTPRHTEIMDKHLNHGHTLKSWTQPNHGWGTPKSWAPKTWMHIAMSWDTLKSWTRTNHGCKHQNHLNNEHTDTHSPPIHTNHRHA